jgi:hypothetical protein
VFNDEYRHTSLIATLRKSWNLGEALTWRDASARTFDDLFTLDEPRDPETWASITALPVPAWQLDEEAINKGLSGRQRVRRHRVEPHRRLTSEPRSRASPQTHWSRREDWDSNPGASCPANGFQVRPWGQPMMRRTSLAAKTRA